MQVQFKSMRPILETNDVKATIQFYSQVLGFTVQETLEKEGMIKWATVAKDATAVMFTTREAAASGQPPKLSGELNFYIDDVDQYWEALKDKSEVVYPVKNNMSNGRREFAIRDNNGYILRFGSPLENKNQYHRYFPSSLVLESSRVKLRLLSRQDKEPLQKISSSADIWTYFTKDLSKEEELTGWIEEALEDRFQEKRMPFVIIDKENETICGCTSLGNISLTDKRVEIGWTWLGKNSIGTGINHHAKFMLLSYAFDVLKVERVEIKTDDLNERAKAALRKIGAKEEGVLRSHMQMPNNRRRDSVYFSIIKSEWEEVKFFHFSDLS